MTSYERELGRLQADMENVNAKQDRMEKKFDALEEKMDARFAKLESLLSEGKGAWKVIVFVGGVAGSLVTLVGAKILFLLQLIK